jgi:hypothetical protein
MYTTRLSDNQKNFPLNNPIVINFHSLNTDSNTFDKINHYYLYILKDHKSGFHRLSLHTHTHEEHSDWFNSKRKNLANETTKIDTHMQYVLSNII